MTIKEVIDEIDNISELKMSLVFFNEMMKILPFHCDDRSKHGWLIVIKTYDLENKVRF